MKEWKNQEPITSIAFKIDGINVRLSEEGKAVSRNSKPLNVPADFLEKGCTYEVFVKDFDTTASIVRGSTVTVTKDCLYKLTPEVDPRLKTSLDTSISDALALGYEGLVYNGKYKHKPKLSYDVPVEEVVPGKGKFEGMMGALVTPLGKVGTGFTEKQRAYPWEKGELIEVECMGLTKNGRFRHPRFIRIRWDKDVDSA